LNENNHKEIGFTCTLEVSVSIYIPPAYSIMIVANYKNKGRYGHQTKELPLRRKVALQAPPSELCTHIKQVSYMTLKATKYKIRFCDGHRKPKPARKEVPSKVTQTTQTTHTYHLP
jgi:hypothetical protein